jgi:hypothetical protein
MLFAATTASAQFSDHEVGIASQQTFMDPATANATLKTNVDQIHLQIPGLSGQPLTVARMKAQYYKAMIHAIEDGMNVGDALSTSLDEAIYHDPSKSAGDPNVKQMLNQVYIETANMLAI